MNPKTINEDKDAATLLNIFLIESINQGVTAWYKDQIFLIPKTLQSSETHFTLEFSLLRRPRKRQDGDKQVEKTGYRIELFDESRPFIAKGSYGTIRRALGTIVLSEQCIKYHENKPRVIKFFNTTVDCSNEAYLTARHLHAKRPVRIKTTEEVRGTAIVMKYFSGVSLKNLLKQDTLEHPLSVENRQRLTVALLTAYINQVTDVGLIHRDVKSDNIMVDGEHVFFLDYDEACTLTTEVVNPKINLPFSPSPTLSSPSNIGSPLALFTIYPDSSNQRRYRERPSADEIIGFIPVGTLGYIPPEGYIESSRITPYYDHFALARVLAQIWKIPVTHYNVRLPIDYVRAETDADCVVYKMAHPNGLSLSQDACDQIELILARLATPIPEKRSSIQDALFIFQNLSLLDVSESRPLGSGSFNCSAF
ncbi:MAG: hypothetical protein NTW08_01925 [Gammaproteobacteria bacterium]|nr:hypothetical protein [Gammaproteobacteria bacterium]